MPAHAFLPLTINAVSLYVEAILTGDLKAQVGLRPAGHLILFVILVQVVFI